MLSNVYAVLCLLTFGTITSIVLCDLTAPPPAPSSQFFYSDLVDENSLNQKILSLEESERIKQQILDTLGFDHKPQPMGEHALNQSSSRYLMGVYDRMMNKKSDSVSVGEFNSGKVKRSVNEQTNEMNNNDEKSDLTITFKNMISKNRVLKSSRWPFRWRRIWFKTENTLKFDDHEVFDAKLLIYRHLHNSRLNSKFLINITLCESQDGFPQGQLCHLIIDTVTFTDHNGWIEFTVTESVLRWIRNSTHNLGLYLKIRSDNYSDKDLSPEMVGIHNNPSICPQDQPFMTVYLKKKEHEQASHELWEIITNERDLFPAGRPRKLTLKIRSDKQRRDAPQVSVEYGNSTQTVTVTSGNLTSTPSIPRTRFTEYYDHDKDNEYLQKSDKPAGKGDSKCRRRRLFVPFKTLGWSDWVIGPEGYSAYFCDGICSWPLKVDPGFTTHAYIQSLAHAIDKDIPDPCCAPVRHSNFMMLYRDDFGNVSLKKLLKMVVDSCACL